MDALALQVETSFFQCETVASQNEFSASREEIQLILDNPILFWLLSTDTPTKQISAELATSWLVPSTEHLASKFLFLGKELELGVPLSLARKHIKSQASAPGSSFGHLSQTP